MDMAQGFWGLLIPHGLQGGALSHIATLPGRDNGEDVRMGAQEEGWNDELTQWWFEYLTEKGIKGVSKDVWQMVCHPLLISSRVAKFSAAPSSWSSSALLTQSLRSTI